MSYKLSAGLTVEVHLTWFFNEQELEKTGENNTPNETL